MDNQILNYFNLNRKKVYFFTMYLMSLDLIMLIRILIDNQKMDFINILFLIITVTSTLNILSYLILRRFFPDKVKITKVLRVLSFAWLFERLVFSSDFLTSDKEDLKISDIHHEVIDFKNALEFKDIDEVLFSDLSENYLKSYKLNMGIQMTLLSVYIIILIFIYFGLFLLNDLSILLYSACIFYKYSFLFLFSSILDYRFLYKAIVFKNKISILILYSLYTSDIQSEMGHWFTGFITYLKSINVLYPEKYTYIPYIKRLFSNKHKGDY